LLRGLACLKRAGVLNWLRRCVPARDEQGRFRLEQDTNAYAVLPVSQWKGFHDEEPPPAPHPSTWGAISSLPDAITLAADEMQHGQRRAALAVLESDPQDELAAALARIGRHLGIDAKRESQ
jgi:hypothetical protein